MENTNKIEKVIYHLLRTEPFFANFLLGARLIFNHPEVKTAAAQVYKGEVRFMFNTDYLYAKPLAAQAAIMKHEIFHVLLDHCGPRGGGGKNRIAKNYAMDCAINQHIKDLPEGCITLDSMKTLTKKDLSPFECWEYYYEQMKQTAKKNGPGKPGDDGIPMEDDGSPRDHDQMEQGEETELDAAQRKAAVKDLANKAMAASAGLAPDGLAKILGELNKAAKIPWKQQLRNLVASARSTKNIPTRMRINRRFDLDQPGKKKLKELVLGVCVDTSGSVSDEVFMSFMTEVHSLSKNTTITYLVYADCIVQKVQVIKGGKPKAKDLTERHGQGGTAYQPAIDECMKRGCNAVLYMGDFDSSDTPKDPGVPFIWVGVGNSPPPGNFGRVIRLD